MEDDGSIRRNSSTGTCRQIVNWKMNRFSMVEWVSQLFLWAMFNSYVSLPEANAWIYGESMGISMRKKELFSCCVD